MSNTVLFDPQIKWYSLYRRNYKEKKSKHILCFPSHNQSGHRATEFCGASIKLYVNYHDNKRILIFGNFSFDDDRKSEYRYGSLITKDIFKNNDKRKYPLYIAEERDSETNINKSKTFIINRKLKAWTMNDRLYKSNPNYAFRVFLFEETSNEGQYKCIYSIKSPPFQIVSSRKVRSLEIEDGLDETNESMLLQDLFANDIYSDISEQIKSPVTDLSKNDSFNNSDMKEILEEMKENSSFKYGDIMPHVYEKDKNNENEYQRIVKPHKGEQNKRVVEKDAFTSEDMRNVFQEIINSKQSNTVYKIKNWFDMAFVLPNNNEADKTSEELSCFGTNIHQDLSCHVGFEYLDKYGNKYKFIPSQDVINI